MRRAIAAAVAFALMVPCAISAQQKVPLVLHHLIARIDSATYHDVINSPFIRGQFAATQAGYRDGVDGGPGIRLMGKYNFLQVTPGLPPNFPVGDVGIVLASEHPGGLEQVKKQGEFGPGAREESAISTHNPEAVYYFEFSDRLRPAGGDSTSDRVEFELLQYSADAVRRQFAVDSLPATNLTNGRFLTRFYDPKKLFSYLTGATLAIPVDDITRISRVLQRDGVTVFAEGEGAIIKLDGFTLHLIPSFVGAGVKQLQFALTRTAIGNPVYRFGPKSQLRFGPGPIAVWDFTSQ